MHSFNAPPTATPTSPPIPLDFKNISNPEGMLTVAVEIRDEDSDGLFEEVDRDAIAPVVLLLLVVASGSSLSDIGAVSRSLTAQEEKDVFIIEDL